MNNCERLFWKTSSFDSPKLGVVGPPLDDLVVLTSEIKVDWKISRTVFPDRFSDEAIEELILPELKVDLCRVRV